MLPQFGMSEFLLIAIVALIVVGPKDLPLMMRKLGQMAAKARSMAGEFRSAFDDIAKQAELDELRKEIEALKRDNVVQQAADELSAAERDINARVMAGDKAAPRGAIAATNVDADADADALGDADAAPGGEPAPAELPADEAMTPLKARGTDKA